MIKGTIAENIGETDERWNTFSFSITFGLDMTIKEKGEKQLLGANVHTFSLKVFSRLSL